MRVHSCIFTPGGFNPKFKVLCNVKTVIASVVLMPSPFMLRICGLCFLVTILTPKIHIYMIDSVVYILFDSLRSSDERLLSWNLIILCCYDI